MPAKTFLDHYKLAQQQREAGGQAPATPDKAPAQAPVPPVEVNRAPANTGSIFDQASDLYKKQFPPGQQAPVPPVQAGQPSAPQAIGRGGQPGSEEYTYFGAFQTGNNPLGIALDPLQYGVLDDLEGYQGEAEKRYEEVTEETRPLREHRRRTQSKRLQALETIINSQDPMKIAKDLKKVQEYYSKVTEDLLHEQKYGGAYNGIDKLFRAVDGYVATGGGVNTYDKPIGAIIDEQVQQQINDNEARQTKLGKAVKLANEQLKNSELVKDIYTSYMTKEAELRAKYLAEIEKDENIKHKWLETAEKIAAKRSLLHRKILEHARKSVESKLKIENDAALSELRRQQAITEKQNREYTKQDRQDKKRILKAEADVAAGQAPAKIEQPGLANKKTQQDIDRQSKFTPYDIAQKDVNVRAKEEEIKGKVQDRKQKAKVNPYDLKLKEGQVLKQEGDRKEQAQDITRKEIQNKFRKEVYGDKVAKSRTSVKKADADLADTYATTGNRIQKGINDRIVGRKTKIEADNLQREYDDKSKKTAADIAKSASDAADSFKKLGIDKKRADYYAKNVDSLVESRDSYRSLEARKFWKESAESVVAQVQAARKYKDDRKDKLLTYAAHAAKYIIDKSGSLLGALWKKKLGDIAHKRAIELKGIPQATNAKQLTPYQRFQIKEKASERLIPNLHRVKGKNHYLLHKSERQSAKDYNKVSQAFGSIGLLKNYSQALTKFYNKEGKVVRKLFGVVKPAFTFNKEIQKTYEAAEPAFNAFRASLRLSIIGPGSVSNWEQQTLEQLTNKEISINQFFSKDFSSKVRGVALISARSAISLLSQNFEQTPEIKETIAKWKRVRDSNLRALVRTGKISAQEAKRISR